jgi:PKHD-type hydroxylase
MHLKVEALLTAEQVSFLRKALDDAQFVDGKATAGRAAESVKNNRQLDCGTPLYVKLATLIANALNGNSQVAAFAMPRNIHSLLFSKTGMGEYYGPHVDNSIMGGLRTDVSFTVFLADPTEYDGGELQMGDDVVYKLNAGDAIIYPTVEIHQVRPVSRGERVICCGWFQSLIRSGESRQILYDLQLAKQKIFQTEGKSVAFDLVDKSISNLIRAWAET